MQLPLKNRVKQSGILNSAENEESCTAPVALSFCHSAPLTVPSLCIPRWHTHTYTVAYQIDSERAQCIGRRGITIGTCEIHVAAARHTLSFNPFASGWNLSIRRETHSVSQAYKCREWRARMDQRRNIWCWKIEYVKAAAVKNSFFCNLLRLSNIISSPAKK